MSNELREAVRALSLLTRLLERASGDISLAHYRVLAAIGEGDERASRLAAKLALGKPTISASVDMLTRKGLITREGVPGDQRASSLRLTEQGGTMLAAVEGEMNAVLRELTERTPAARSAIASLAALSGAMDKIRSGKAATR
ncbi:MarR family winged helix-turn-helix transcriptional regulator [Streptomyces sp. RB6PN25]|uniref:MarR family winged helix-turn-helix transcriptional regulator n=1 Tax=Streptomyces humicola TaxID=2953240 RepID=A0ABT1PNB3_9ACTN|nr:MarR family winged helix-turn-helix transcriptional regulator [Streptomyces humicola]MCQ4079161.1 MarR family winged helix-turn-helix transcriptional regulator [Streptomyces humicola]